MKNKKEPSVPGQTIFLREDGIVYVDIARAISGKGDMGTIKDVLNKVKKIIRNLSGEKKFLVRNTSYLGTSVTGSKYRKELAEIVKKTLNEIDFNKVAMFGGDVISRVITSFIITATGLGNFKVFRTEEEALKWLEKR